jgi:hypothetical protein
VIDDLQSQGRFTASLFTEDDGRGRGAGIPENLVPGRVKRPAGAVLLEERICLRILLTERILFQTMMFKKLLNFHRVINFQNCD